jgi:putative transposase
MIPMSHTYSAQFMHVVFSTKDRRPLIPPELQTRLMAYVGGIMRKIGIGSVAIRGTTNHLHIVMKLPPLMPLAEAVQKLKANSSRWLGEQGVRFEWQKGYGAFSVSPSMLPVVSAYVANQEQHHRARTFEDEFVALLKKSGLSFDERKALG